MKEMRITLYGDPRSKKNSQRPVPITDKRTGKTYTKLLPSAAFEKYEKDCIRQITGDKKRDISQPVNVCCTYYMQTVRAVDLVNLQEGTLDLLVHAGVLHDDNRNIVASMDGSRVLYDKRNPRVEITITDAEESYTQWDTRKGVKSRESLLDRISGAAESSR